MKSKDQAAKIGKNFYYFIKESMKMVGKIKLAKFEQWRSMFVLWFY